MNSIYLVIKEIWHRKISSLLILLSVFVASTVSVAIYSLSKASENETRKIMREQGLNLYIFPKGTDLIDFFSVGNTETFPDSYVDSLASSRTFDAVRHLTGILQVKYPGWTDPNGSKHQILLVGYKDEAMQRFLPAQELMGTDVLPGTVQLGAFVSVNIPEGEPFRITGSDGTMHEFRVAGRFAEGKGMIDQGVAFNLGDLQKILGMEGQINKIEALGCVCHDGRIKNARNQVQAIFPDLEVTEITNIADARENQRLMMNKYGAFIIPFIMAASLLISGLMFYSNVNSRRYEIGILKALGRRRSYIISIILQKAFILAFIGSAAGFVAGTFIAGYFGETIFRFTAADISPLWNVGLVTVSAFPVLWMLAGWVPALSAAQTDAAAILSRE